MLPSPINPGWKIIKDFSKAERLTALVEFYRTYQGGALYPLFVEEMRNTLKLGLFR